MDQQRPTPIKSTIKTAQAPEPQTAINKLAKKYIDRFKELAEARKKVDAELQTLQGAIAALQELAQEEQKAVAKLAIEKPAIVKPIENQPTEEKVE